MNRKYATLAWLIAAALLVVMMPLPLLGQDSPAQEWIRLYPGYSDSVERVATSGVYSPATNRLIIFGGNILGLTLLNDVWIQTNANGLGGTPQWLKVNLSNPPQARKVHSAVYDAANERMIIFGGCSGFCTPALNDVWVLKNASATFKAPAWQQLSPVGTPPVPREHQTAVYDPASNTMIIYGGDEGFQGRLSDVWVLSHANGLGGTPQWTQLFPVGGPPTGQVWHSAVYDPSSNIMTVFGGVDIANIPTNEVWTLSHANGIGGTPVWTKLSMQYGDCPARYGHKAVFDPSTNTMTVFGGGNADGVPTNDTWVLWNANGLGGSPRWTEMYPSGDAPLARAHHVLTFDAANNRMILFAGESGEGNHFSSWVMTHANGN